MTNRVLRIFALCALALGFIAAPAFADDLADAKAVIGKQLEQIKKGDLAGLKAGFTARQKDKITDAMVKDAQKEIAKYTLDDLVQKVEAKAGGSLKIKMKGDRTLTTLVKTDGKWLADTLWFK